MGWIISPSEDVENYDNGSFKLPCRTSNVTYSITYVSPEGCSSNTVSYTYVTSGDCETPPPDCPTQSSIINTNTAVANTGGTQVAVMQILKNSTYTAYTITATSTSSSYVSNINQGAELHDDWYVVLADVTANPGTTCRSLYFDVIAEGPTLGTGCTYNNVTVTQCPTQSSIINTNTAVVSTGGTQVAVMQILKDSTTYTAYTITSSSSYVSNITQGAHLHDNWYVVLADVTANPNTSDRSLYFDVIAEGPTLGDGCTYNDVKVIQKGVCPTVYYHGSTIPTEGSSMGLPLMYWSPSDDYPLNTFSVSYTGDGITSTEFITSSSLIPGQTVNVLLVKFSANTGTSSRTFNVHLSTSVSSDCTWDNTYTQEGADSCPASGGTMNPNDGVVCYLGSNPTVPGCAGTDGGKYAFKFDDPEFDGINHISVDGVVVEDVSTYEISIPNCKCLAVTTTQNPSTTATRTGSITIVMNRVGGGQCSYTIPVTQRAYSSSECTTPSQHATIDYKNETGTQIQDGIGYLYDSDGNVITTFTIHEMNAGITLQTPVSQNVFGSTVASAKAMVHTAGQGGTLYCKTVSGSIIGATLKNGDTYTFNISGNAC